MRVLLCGRRSTWWRSSVTFRDRRSTWWRSSVTFRDRRSTWWRSSVTFRDRRSTWWRSSVFVDRRSTWWMLKCHFSWQAQAQYLVKVKCHFSWQAQYLVKVKCHFSWQAQYLVKFGKIAGARNVVFFNRKCSSGARKVTSVARRVADWRVHGRNGLGSFSDRPRIGNDVSAVFSKFLLDVGWSFCVAGAVFGEVGWWHLLLRAL